MNKVHKFKVTVQTPYVGGDYEEEFEIEEWADCTDSDIEEEAEGMAEQIRNENFGFDLTNQTNCHACGEETDFLIGTNLKPTCDDCKNAFGEECKSNKDCNCANFCRCGNAGVNANGFCRDCI